jgi:hypothetical protein
LPNVGAQFTALRLPSERGATLAEVLIAVFLAAALMGLIGTAFYQFYAASRWGLNHLTALSDLQQAGLWLARDANQSQTFAAGAGSVYGTLRWPGSTEEYRYSYDAADTALVREHLVGGSVQATHVVARHIAAQGDVAFSLSGDLLTVNITSTVGGVSPSTELQLQLRVD